MNILLVSHTGELGGASRMLLGLARGIRGLGTVHCIMPGLNAGLAEAMYQIGVEIFRAKTGAYNPEIVAYIEAHGIDCVISNTLTITGGAAAASACGVRHIWWVHEILPEEEDHSDLFEYIESSGTVVAISEAVRRALGIESAIVIHNGIPVIDEPESISADPVVMTVGGFCRRKNQLMLLRAARGVIDEIPEAQFISIGGTWDDIYFSRFRRLRKTLDISKHQFIHHGFKRDIERYYRRARVFALSSETEPFGLVLLEAMNAGLPVVATRSGGPEEIVVNGETGFLVPVDDSGAMAEKIIYLLNSPEQIYRMGDAGRARLKQYFSYERFIGDFTRVIAA